MFLNKALSNILSSITKNSAEGGEEGKIHNSRDANSHAAAAERMSVTLEREKSAKKYQIPQNRNTLRAAADSVDRIFFTFNSLKWSS